MPDGYGDNTDLALINALNMRPGASADRLIRQFIAQHLHFDHGMSKYEVRQRLNVTMRELRDLLGENG